MAADEEVNEVLRQARDLVMRPGGWCQGTMSMEGGAFCALGAIQQAALNRRQAVESSMLVISEKIEMMRRAENELKAVLNEMEYDYVGIAWWNDEPHRTKDQVVGLFEKAIAREVID